MLSSERGTTRGIVTNCAKERPGFTLASRTRRIARNGATSPHQAGLANKDWNKVSMTFRAVVVAFTLLLSFPALAAQKAAVFPFDFRDAEQEGEMVPQFKDTDLARLKLVAEELKSLMQKDGRYEVVDLTAQAGEIEKASPFNKCDGCEAEIAGKAGAELAVTGFVDKVSDALISLQIFVRDVKTGKLLRAMSAEVRGNTDELWLHGLRWLWRNRFNPEEKKN